jgi:hypothetical protein
MENASKALLIAAGVLIVILLIAFGMSIFNSTGDTAGQIESATSTQDLQAFNAKFTPYIGAGRNGSTIPNLLAVVNATNKANSAHDVTIVCATKNVITNAATSAPKAAAQVTKDYTTGADFSANNKYTITASYGADGYIYAITIQ